MNLANIWNKAHQAIMGQITKSISDKIGEQSYGFTKTLTLNSGASVNENIQVSSYDMFVKNINIYAVYDDQIILDTDTSLRDIINIQIKHHDLDVFGGQAIDIYEYRKWAMSETFEGFFLPQKELLEVSLAHTSKNITSGTIAVNITMYGRKVNLNEIYKFIKEQGK